MNEVTYYPAPAIPYYTLERDGNNALVVVYYDAQGTRFVSADPIIVVPQTNELSIGLNVDGTPKHRFTAHPFTGEPIIKFGMDTHIGNHLQVKVAKTETLLIVGGGSHFAAAEDGTPLHITYVQKNGKWEQKIVEASDAELAKHYYKKSDFKKRESL